MVVATFCFPKDKCVQLMWWTLIEGIFQILYLTYVLLYHRYLTKHNRDSYWVGAGKVILRLLNIVWLDYGLALYWTNQTETPCQMWILPMRFIILICLADLLVLCIHGISCLGNG